VETKTIVVTGGAGYIGSHTIIELLGQTKYNVISIDNYSNSSPKTYERIEKITGKKIKFFATDLCNKEETEAIFKNNKGIAGVIHFAAFKSVPESVADPLKYYHNNVNSLVNLLYCLNKYGVNNFIFSSSCSVYGDIQKLPVSEETPFQKAQCPYAYTKVIGENIIEDYCKAYKSSKSIALRYFNPVGAHISGLTGELPLGSPTNLVPVITQTAIGNMDSFKVNGNDYNTRDGSCVRDYVHVSDIAAAHVLALNLLIENKNKNNYEVFNLGTGKGVSVLEAIKAFEEVTGIKPNYKIGPRREGDVEAIFSDCKKVNTVLGWNAKYNLDQMMESAWKWEKYLKENPQI
jgi:UDP-glucose 4-epimerase